MILFGTHTFVYLSASHLSFNIYQLVFIALKNSLPTHNVIINTLHHLMQVQVSCGILRGKPGLAQLLSPRPTQEDDELRVNWVGLDLLILAELS